MNESLEQAILNLIKTYLDSKQQGGQFQGLESGRGRPSGRRSQRGATGAGKGRVVNPQTDRRVKKNQL